MTVDLDKKERFIIKNYIEDMLDLFEENDMLNENEAIYLSHGDLILYKKDLIELEKKVV